MKEKYKDLCQVFTPEKNVDQMLNWCNYKDDLYGKKIVENSFGEGNILTQIIRRYIEDCIKQGIPNNQIQNGLNQDIYGYEIDKKHYDKCIENLNDLLTQYNLEPINWENIYLEDALSQIQDNYFSFVIGNPPYIKYKSLDEEDRIKIKEKFSTCKLGKFDYCYAFIQRSIDSLDINGKMAYLIPSSIFKNVFAEEIRKYILPHLTDIYDYTTIRLFDKKTNSKGKARLTSSSVIVLQKGTRQDYITYTDLAKNKKIQIKKENLQKSKKWIFDEQLEEQHNRKLKDYFKISNTIATLYNKAYVIQNNNIEKEDEKYIYLKDGSKMEKQIIKITASPKMLAKGKSEKIIFPYSVEKNKVVRYDIEAFEENYKYTCEYLKKHKEKLNNRKSDKNATWFEYGRSQAIGSITSPKLLVSTVITNKVNTYMLEEGIIPYSGIYIQPTKELTLQDAQNILQSNDFLKYVKKIGIHASGESYRITSKDIGNYEF